MPDQQTWAGANQSDGPNTWTETRQTPVLRSMKQVAADGPRPTLPVSGHRPLMREHCVTSLR